MQLCSFYLWQKKRRHLAAHVHLDYAERRSTVPAIREVLYGKRRTIEIRIASGENAANFNHMYCIYITCIVYTYATKSPLFSHQIRWYKSCILTYKI